MEAAFRGLSLYSVEEKYLQTAFGLIWGFETSLGMK